MLLGRVNSSYFFCGEEVADAMHCCHIQITLVTWWALESWGAATRYTEMGNRKVVLQFLAGHRVTSASTPRLLGPVVMESQSGPEDVFMFTSNKLRI